MLLAHGIGGRDDLPLPFSFVLTGAIVALVVSFCGLGLLWSSPRLRGAEAGRTLPTGFAALVDSKALRGALRLVGMLVAGWFLAAGIFGRDLEVNPFPGAVYVLLWVGLVPLSVLLGPVWRLVSPLRTLHVGFAALSRTPADEGIVALPAWMGRWPAAIGLFAFVWLELVVPGSASLDVLRAWFAGYAAVLLVGAAVFGSGWFRAADPFEAWSDAFGRLSPLGRRADGRLVLRSPLDSVTTLPVEPGTVAVVAVMLGSTAWDSFGESTQWAGFVQETAHPTAWNTAGLMATILLVGGAFAAAVLVSGGLVPARVRRGALPGQFAHTLVPIALGYVIAHYYSLLIYQGQRTVILATDPLQRGADYLGLRDAAISTALIGETLVAVVQVGAVVAGHVLGVVLAHDRAVALFDRRRAVLGQLPLLVLMVLYTVAGLLLLFNG